MLIWLVPICVAPVILLILLVWGLETGRIDGHDEYDSPDDNWKGPSFT